MKTWYQVYLKDKIFGFSSVEGSVFDNSLLPYNFKGMLLKDIRYWFIQNNAKVIKICDQIII